MMVRPPMDVGPRRYCGPMAFVLSIRGTVMSDPLHAGTPAKDTSTITQRNTWGSWVLTIQAENCS